MRKNYPIANPTINSAGKSGGHPGKSGGHGDQYWKLTWATFLKLGVGGNNGGRLGGHLGYPGQYWWPYWST